MRLRRGPLILVACAASFTGCHRQADSVSLLVSSSTLYARDTTEVRFSFSEAGSWIEKPVTVSFGSSPTNDLGTLIEEEGTGEWRAEYSWTQLVGGDENAAWHSRCVNGMYHGTLVVTYTYQRANSEGGSSVTSDLEIQCP